MADRFDTASLLSDLGTTDEHVGVVKAILRDLAPHVQVIDLTHHIGPGDVRAGSLALARAASYLPTGIVMVAVDSGERQPIAIEVASGRGVLLGPDNGVLAPAVAMVGGAERAVVLDRPEFHLVSPGATSLVRDVLAPVAAHLCNGVDLAALGRLVDADSLLPGIVPLARETDESGPGVDAEVLWVDQLGNCQLNIGLADLDPWGAAPGARLQVLVGEQIRSVMLVDRIGALGPGSVGLWLDPHGLLTIVLHRRSAAAELGLAAADHVTLRPDTDQSRRGVDQVVSVPIEMRR